MEDNASRTSKPDMYTSQGHAIEHEIRYVAAMPPMHESPQPLSEFSDYTTSTESSTATADRVDDSKRGISASFLKCLGRNDSPTSGLPGLMNGKGDRLPLTPVFSMRGTGDQEQAVVPPPSLGPAIEAAQNALVAAANAASPPPTPHVNGIAKGAPPFPAAAAAAVAAAVPAVPAASKGGSPPVRSTDLSSPGVDSQGGVSPSSTSSHVVRKVVAVEDDGSGCDEADAGIADGGMEKGGDAALLTPRSREGTRKTLMMDGDTGGMEKGGDAALLTPRSREGTRKTLVMDGAIGVTEKVRSESPVPRILPRARISLRSLNGRGRLEDAFALARDRVKEIRPLESAMMAAELGGLLRQAVLGDWHSCAMPVREPPRERVQENAEWNAWIASEGVSKQEAMEIFTTAVNKLYQQKFPNADLITWVSTTDSDTVSGEPVTAELQSSVDLGQSLIPRLPRNDIENVPEKGMLVKCPRESNAQSPQNNASASRVKTLFSSRKALSLSAKPVFSGQVAVMTKVDAAASRRVMTDEDTKLENKGDDASHTAVEQRDCQDGVADNLGSGSKRSNDDDWRMRSTVGSVSTDAAAADAAAADAGVADQRMKTGILFKKREIFPGWRPRTFILDKSQKLLRYYLPSSANPRGNIPLEGCLVDFSASATDKGEAGPDGARLFRIRLITGPIPSNNIASPRFVGLVGGGGSPEGMSKTYILAATSFREAQSWASAIREVADLVDHSRERSVDRSFSVNGSLESQQGRQHEGVLSRREEASSAAAAVESCRWGRSPVNGITSDPAERRGSCAGASVAFAAAAAKEAYQQNHSPETTADPPTPYPESAKSVQPKEETKNMDATREHEGFPQWFLAFTVMAAAVVLILLECVMVPLGWVGVSAGSVGTMVAIAADRSRFRKQRRYLEQLLRDFALGNDRYHVRFWVDVQPLMAQLEHIHDSSDNDREFRSPGRHSKAVVQSSDVTVLHLVMKAAASAVMQVNSPRGPVVEKGEKKNRAREGLSARETRESVTRVACLRALDTHRTRIGSLDGEPCVVVIEGAERKSAAMIAAEVLTAGDLTGREEEGVETVSRWSNGVDLFPVLLRQPPNEVPLLHPESLSDLAALRCARDVGTRGDVFSTRIPWHGVEGRADCLVEVKPFSPPPTLRQKASNLAGVSQDTLLSKVYGDVRLLDLSSALDGNGSGVREMRTVIRAPLRVIVGCTNALVDEREEKGTMSDAPVTMLEISVVGNATTGERITGDFARALKRCLLRFER